MDGQIAPIEHMTEYHAVCPWCDNTLKDDSPFEFFQSEGQDGDTKTAECPKCSKLIHCAVNVQETRTVHYLTRKFWGEVSK